MIGFLNAYLCSPELPEYQVQYGKMFLSFFEKSTPNLKFKEYKVAQGEWPQSVDECDGWVISGSSKSAYDQDQWILRLGQFIRECHAANSKLVGICFGHQLIAHVLGGKTSKSEKGWGVGVHQFDILQQERWMQPPLNKCSLIFSHQDQVLQLPPLAKHLAANDFCSNQMFSVSDHIFCMQGHPEFSPEFAQNRLDSRIELLGNQTYKSAVQTLSAQTNSDVVSHWIENFFSL